MLVSTVDELAKRIRNRRKLAPFRDLLLSKVRPAIEITANRRAKNALPVGSSKFGGLPDVAEGDDWPCWDGRPRAFIGQVALADLVGFPAAASLPDRGLLSFFYTYDVDEGMFLRDDGSWQTILTLPDAPLTRLEKPRGLRPFTKRERPLSFSGILDLPYDGFQFGDETLDEDPWADSWDTYRDLRRLLHDATHHLFGYPAHNTLAYDPTPGPEWCSLVTLSSDDYLGWCWGDGDRLMAFVRKDDLAAGNITTPVKVDEG